MKTRTHPRAPQPARDVLPPAERDKKPRVAQASNTSLNQQNRRALAQHYRAKYGVK